MDDLETLASLLRRQNETGREIAKLIGRPALPGHIGEFIAARVFDIALESTVTRRAIDGHFRSGPLKGKSVDVKWYGKREGILDLNPTVLPDFYLVLTGPRSPAGSSRGTTRPLVLDSVFLFDAKSLVSDLKKRGVKIGIASSVARRYLA